MNSQRYIGQIDTSHWLASFVSLGILGEILCVFPQVFSISDFTNRDINSLIDGLQKIFRYFEANHVFSFNASLFFGPDDQRFFPAHLRLIPRTFLNTRDFAPDASFFQSLLQEPISVVMPEDLCAALKKYFI